MNPFCPYTIWAEIESNDLKKLFLQIAPGEQHRENQM